MTVFISDQSTLGWTPQFWGFIASIRALGDAIASVVDGYAFTRAMALKLVSAAVATCYKMSLAYICFLRKGTEAYW